MTRDTISKSVFDAQISMLFDLMNQKEKELIDTINRVQFVLSDVIDNPDYSHDEIVKSIDRHEKLFELDNGFISRDEFDLWHRLQSSQCNDDMTDEEFWFTE